MVYCGKASLGCQHCRTRRIKCDKVRPECSQCIRQGKKCPGYRDQLSLMFRDESTKVMQKAHAQWGVADEDAASSSSSAELESPTNGKALLPIATSSSSRRRAAARVGVPGALQSSRAANAERILRLNVPKPVNLTSLDKGLYFYVEHFVAGHPDEPFRVTDINSLDYLKEDGVRGISSAIGLCALSNLTNNEEGNEVAAEKYGEALQLVARKLTSGNGMRSEIGTRLPVMLAMFEIVSGKHEETGSASTHILGMAAMIRSLLPKTPAPYPGLRALLQLIYSLFIPCHVLGMPLPAVVFDWISTSEMYMMTSADRFSTPLVKVIARFVQLSAWMCAHALTDDRPTTAGVIQQLLDLDADLEEWADSTVEEWRFTVHEDKFPPEACFRSQYHVYRDMLGGRVWNHYRWARLCVNEMLFNCVEAYPLSSLPLMTEARRQRSLNVIRELSEDMLVGVPVHYRHPALDQRQTDLISQTSGGAGMAVVGVPSLLFQIKVAACAPGVPDEHWRWALGILDSVWSHMGMSQARALANDLRLHKERLTRIEDTRKATASAAATAFKAEPLD